MSCNAQECDEQSRHDLGLHLRKSGRSHRSLAVEDKIYARQREAEERRAAKEQVAAAGSELETFEQQFFAAHDAVSTALCCSRAAGTILLVDLGGRLEKMHALVSSTVSVLPVAIREQCLNKLSSLEASLKLLRKEVVPRKKFAFKNREKVHARTSHAATNSTHANGREAAPHSDSFQAPAGCHGFRDELDARLDRPPSDFQSGDFALENLTRCAVTLLAGSKSLWIRGLEGCVVFSLPMAGSIYVTQCRHCILYLGEHANPINSALF